MHNLLPTGDAYIFEDVQTSNQPAQQQITSLSVQLQRSQLSAMMLAILDTTGDPNGNPCEPRNNHRVHYLRSRTPARLFRTLVGSERVSAQATVMDILGRGSNSVTPVHYTPITVEQGLREMFERKRSVEKEKLCHALLLTMAFMDLVVFQTPQVIRLYYILLFRLFFVLTILLNLNWLFFLQIFNI